MYFIVKASSTKYTKVQSKLDDLSIVSSENLKGSREVRGFATQEKEKERFIKEAKAYQKEALSIAKISSLLNPFTSVITNIAIIAIIIIGTIIELSFTIPSMFFISIIYIIVPLIIAVMIIGILNSCLKNEHSPAHIAKKLGF